MDKLENISDVMQKMQTFDYTLTNCIDSSIIYEYYVNADFVAVSLGISFGTYCVVAFNRKYQSLYAPGVDRYFIRTYTGYWRSNTTVKNKVS